MSKCKWLEPFNHICCNGDCYYVADNPPMKCESEEDCSWYERRENDE